MKEMAMDTTCPACGSTVAAWSRRHGNPKIIVQYECGNKGEQWGDWEDKKLEPPLFDGECDRAYAIAVATKAKKPSIPKKGKRK